MHRYAFLLTLLITPLSLIPSNSSLRGSQLALDNSAHEIRIDIPDTESTPVSNLFFHQLPSHLQEPAIDLANKNTTLKSFEQMQKEHFPKLSERDALLIKKYFQQCADYDLYQKNKAHYYLRLMYTYLFSE